MSYLRVSESKKVLLICFWLSVSAYTMFSPKANVVIFVLQKKTKMKTEDLFP